MSIAENTTCTWQSMKPGSSVRPARSTTTSPSPVPGRSDGDDAVAVDDDLAGCGFGADVPVEHEPAGEHGSGHEATLRARRQTGGVPEGDTIHRVANRLRPALVGQPLVRLEAPRAVGQPAPAGHDDRRRRRRRQAPAHPLRRRHGAAHAPAHDRLVAPLPDRRAVAEARPPRPRPRRGARLGGGVLLGAGGRARARAHRRRRRRPPRPRPHRADVTDADLDACVERLRHLAGPDDEIGAAAPRPAHRRAASATSGRARRCGRAGSTPSPTVADLDAGDATPAVRHRVEAAAGERRRVGARTPSAVYRRAGEPCRRCGTPIRMRRQGEQQRSTYWCPTCQRMSTTRVVVIGAGFGGLAVARGLKDAAVEVTVVDRNNFHTFQPLLYQVATAGLNAADVAYAVRGIVRGLRQRRVPAGRPSPASTGTATRSSLDDGQSPAVRPPRRGRRGHRQLLRHRRRRRALAPAVHARRRRRPAQPRARPLRGRRRRPVAGRRRRPHLRRRRRRPDRRRGRRRAGRAVRTSCCGGTSPASTSTPAADRPRRGRRRAAGAVPAEQPRATPAVRSTTRGVEVRTGTAVESVDADAASRLATGEVIAGPHARLGRRRAGQPARRRPRRRHRPRRAHRRRARPAHRRAPRAPSPSATSPPSTTAHGGLLPGVAQVAMQSGAHVAAEIRRRARRRPTPVPLPRQGEHGDDRPAGRRRRPPGAASASPARIGWLAWLGLHLVQLMGFRNRLSVLLNWTWSYFTWDRGPRLIFGADRRAGQRPARTSSRSSPPPAQPQARPRVVDGAHLRVDEPERQPDLALHVLGQVGRHARRLLRPRHPDPAVDVEGLEQRRDARLEVGPPVVEADDDVERAPRRRASTGTRSGSGSSASRTPSGAPSRATRSPSRMPSFLASGVPL